MVICKMDYPITDYKETCFLFLFFIFFCLFVFFSAQITGPILLGGLSYNSKISRHSQNKPPLEGQGRQGMDSCFSAYGFYYVSGWQVLFVALEFLASSTLKEPVR